VAVLRAVVAVLRAGLRAVVLRAAGFFAAVEDDVEVEVVVLLVVLVVVAILGNQPLYIPE
jgi:membrane protein DedA with SNARE-associated domain